MAKKLGTRFYVAFSDRVVVTDDLKAADLAPSYVSAFSVITRRTGHQFLSVPDGDGNRRAVSRWVGTYLPTGAFQVRYWSDDRSRSDGEPNDIVTFSGGTWKAVHGPYDIVYTEDVEASRSAEVGAE